MTLERYHELFLAQTEVLDEVGITIEDEALVVEIAGEMAGSNLMTMTEGKPRTRSWRCGSFGEPT